MKFKAGDVVNPIWNCIGAGRDYIIDEAIEEHRYKLDSPRLEMDDIDYKVVHSTWSENQLELAKPKIISKINCNVPKISIGGIPITNEIFKKEKDDMEKLIKMYKDRKMNMLKKELDNAIKAAREEDEIQGIIEDTNRLIQDTDPVRVFPQIDVEIFTTETFKKEKEYTEAYSEKVNSLNLMLEEVEALANVAENFEEKMSILKNYGIIDKKGKINI